MAAPKKSKPKWKLYFPKDPKVWKTVIVRQTDGKIHISGKWGISPYLAETPEEAEKEFERIKQLVEKHKSNNNKFRYGQLEMPEYVERRLNVQEHFVEMPLDHRFTGPIELGKVITSRNSGVTGVWARTPEGFGIGIKLDDLLSAIHKSLITDGLVFGTWGFQNVQGEPFLTFEGGFIHNK